jgi:hypothetical protein
MHEGETKYQDESNRGGIPLREGEGLNVTSPEDEQDGSQNSANDKGACERS